MKSDFDILDTLPLVAIVVGGIVIMCLNFFEALTQAAAMRSGLQQCVVAEKIVWQKECGK